MTEKNAKKMGQFFNFFYLHPYFEKGRNQKTKTDGTTMLIDLIL